MIVPHKDIVARKIFLQLFEPAIRDFVNLYLKAGDIFIDVGAHLGYFTLLASVKVGPEGQIHSFEPCRDTWMYLERNIALSRLKNVRANCLALSDRIELRELCVAMDGHAAWNSFADRLPGISFVKQQVPCDTLDHYVQEHIGRKPISLIKIDVEGWECHVLKGGIETLSSPDAPTLLIEFSSVISDRAGSSVQRLRNVLLDLGYMLYRYETPIWPAQAVERSLEVDTGQSKRYETNLVATKDLVSIAQQCELRILT
jgi:FkbM family methyltransferase